MTLFDKRIRSLVFHFALLLVAATASPGEQSVDAEGSAPVVEAYRRLMLEPTKEHFLDAAIAAWTNAPDEQTVEFLRRHLRVTEGTLVEMDGVGYSDAEVACECLEGWCLETSAGGQKIKGIVARWMEEDGCPFRLHLQEMSAEDAVRCDAWAGAWLEGFRAGRAGRPRDGIEETMGDPKMKAHWEEGYTRGKMARRWQR